MVAVATAIGTSILSTLLKPMVERAETEIMDQFDFVIHIKREIQNLKNTLDPIRSVIQVAEEKQIENSHVREWLLQLVDIGYDARDVLDEFYTFSASVRAKQASKRSPSSSSSTVPVALPYGLRSRLASDIRRIRKRLDEMIKQNEIFSILKSIGGGHDGSESVPPTMRQKAEIGPLVDKQRDLFVGREEVKEKIMKILLHPNDNKIVHLVPIWGMGGIGKTTLTQSVYNDEALKEKDYPSKNRRWLCVGEKKFNAKEIIARIIGKPCTPGDIDIEVVQRKFVEKFKGNKFLIVLDDVWDVDSTQWNELWKSLTNVGKGGVIIITTRLRNCITATNSPVMTNYIEPLSDEDCWLIFKSHAFIDGKPDSKVDQKLKIGREIVKKLKGLPLAAKVVGSSLNEADVNTWKEFLDPREWKQTNDEDDIVRALRWSYNQLPPYLKQCFCYCALFPKGHVFNEKVLVEMWMAHDLIQNVGGGGEQRRPEDVGAKYFKELVYSCLFQRVNNQYVMHDMIHDVALHVSNVEFATPNGYLKNNHLKNDDLEVRITTSLPLSSQTTLPMTWTTLSMEKARHITIIRDDDYLKNLSLCSSKKILTLYTVGRNHGGQGNFDKDIFVKVFEQLKSIRVLVLDDGKITTIPESISKLLHLRYLDVRKTRIRNLPDSLCCLYNLQMLAAPADAVLPKKIVNMTNLRYLRANLCTCKGVRNLASLQELSSISVCEDDNIGELGALQHLRGKLTIGLENVTSSHNAARAFMEEKFYIDELELEFSGDLERSTVEEKVLDDLKCPPNLTRLNISGYTGLKTPSWMVYGKLVANLCTLNLSDCNQLKDLPPLGEISSLKHLHLMSMDGVERLGDKFYGKGSSCNVFFPSLESFELRDMKKWKEWGAIPVMDSGTPIISFPCLKELIIYDCPELTDINLPGCHVTTIERLDISVCQKLTKMEFRSLPSLCSLVVGCCDELISISCPIAVKELRIYECKKLKSISTNFPGLHFLEYFKVFQCPLLEPICEEERATSAAAAASPPPPAASSSSSPPSAAASSSSSPPSAAASSSSSSSSSPPPPSSSSSSAASSSSSAAAAASSSSSSSASSSSTKLILSSSPWSRLEHLEIDNELIFRHIFNHNLKSKIRSMYITEDIKIVESLGEIVENKQLELLEKLYIYDCNQLQSLPISCLPHSLQHLSVHNCSQLKSLSADALPPSLRQLTILGCPFLYEQYKDESGLEWHKIKHIRWRNIR